ncbi:prefoldin subunit 6 [Aspergillus luchuensis]|uniref:Prefoldin subunit 6 n=1 Tax=Aspergillus kawachii TaxID=1069201 RepID=A0A146FF94_ASPKA|nr:prefoldin subunit 6 [Aspergillus luchuensis]
MADAQKQMQALTEEFQALQTELDGLVEARQKLESQQQENVGVQKEFNSLDDESNIYKLIGPVLLKQEKSEALMAVNGRLEFIEKEIKRIEGQIQENQDKSDKKRTEVSAPIFIITGMLSAVGLTIVMQIVQFQTQMQQAAAAASA